MVFSQQVNIVYEFKKNMFLKLFAGNSFYEKKSCLPFSPLCQSLQNLSSALIGGEWGSGR